MLQAIKYRNGHLEILDQLQLPHVCSYLPVKDTDAGWEVIRSMKVRGAPAIAIVGALSLASELHEDKAPWTSKQELSSHVAERLAHLETSRPTAVNLANMANELRALAARLEKDNSVSLQDMKHRLADEAEKMLAEDLSANKAMGRHGAEHLLAHCKPPRGATGLGVLTHCNTGSLATAGHGTALGVMRSLHEMGRLDRAYCTETRPYNQGSRLTAFELVHDGIPATLVCDSMVAALMARGEVSAVVVGADRIVANGDTANKVGTYQVAICAKHHGIPFYVAAPTTTVDARTASGREITIEERPAHEMTSIQGIHLAPKGITCWNPAFDVTPAELITGGIITEKGVFPANRILDSLSA